MKFRKMFEITPGRDYVEISKPFRFLNLAKTRRLNIEADYNEEISVITPGWKIFSHLKKIEFEKKGIPVWNNFHDFWFFAIGKFAIPGLFLYICFHIVFNWDSLKIVIYHNWHKNDVEIL